MSVVTNVLLSVGYEDETHTLPELRVRLAAHGLDLPGDLAEAWDDPPERGRRWGGNKYPEVRLFGAAYNHLDLAAFLTLLGGVPWREPECLQLFVREQEADTFTVYELVAGALVALKRPDSR